MDPIQTTQSTGGSAGQKGDTNIGADQLFAIPGVATGDAVYDMIMEEIEPELTSSQINGLTEKYKNETPEEAASRKDRYNKAYIEYEKRFSEYMTHKQGEVATRKRAAMASIEKEERQGEEDKELSNLESAISNT